MEPKPSTQYKAVSRFEPRPISEVLGDAVSKKLSGFIDAVLMSGYGRITLVIRDGKIVQIERTVQELPDR
jgi:hypothetical protein